MTRDTKIVHSHYRSQCTDVHETRDKDGRLTSKTRVRAPEAPSMKQWARGHDEGRAWLRRKGEAPKV